MTNENIRFSDSSSLKQTILDLHDIKVQNYQKNSISYHGVLRRLSSEKGLQTKIPKQKHTNILGKRINREDEKIETRNDS